jgi:hypothetical protein
MSASLVPTIERRTRLRAPSPRSGDCCVANLLSRLHVQRAVQWLNNTHRPTHVHTRTHTHHACVKHTHTSRAKHAHRDVQMHEETTDACTHAAKRVHALIVLNSTTRVHVHGYMCGMRARMYVSSCGIGDVQEKACMHAVIESKTRRKAGERMWNALSQW